jgi:hypothetical protein
MRKHMYYRRVNVWHATCHTLWQRIEGGGGMERLRRPRAKAIAIRPIELFPLLTLVVFYGLILLHKLG